MSKQLATLQYEIETGVDLAEAMGAEPDRGALREFMREFELRAVMERLEEALPEGEAVPGRRVETELEVEAVEGTPADLGESGRRRRWRSTASAGRRPTASGSSPGSRAWTSWRSRSPARPLVAHDVKSLGGGRHGLLAAAAREGAELRARPRHDGRRLPARAAAAHLRADRARRRRRDRPRRGRGAGEATRRTPALAAARRPRRGSIPLRRRASSPPWPRPSGRGSRSWGSSACCARSSCRWSTCWRRWSARG